MIEDDDADFEFETESGFSDLEQDQVEEIAEDLVEVTLDFIDNHELTLSEFNGLMLAQIVKSYMDNGYVDELTALVDHVQKHIDKIASEKPNIH
tara:strand:- start:188 stop:469 length:282 start_codon:yes stop_codon:yes gene_type:complete